MSKSTALEATHSGDLDLNGIILQCYILQDGRRVLSGRGMQAALDLGQSRGQKIPQLVSSKGLNELVNKDLELGIFSPIEFITPSKFKAFGYEATVLVDLCQVLMEARKKGVLSDKYLPTVDKAEQLAISFAKVGIIALVDEATGYQYEREKDELQKILKAYIAVELLPWQKKFPDEFYKEIFRLNGWDYTVNGIKQRPGVIGTWTKNLIYRQLPKGVLKELYEKTPKNASGKLAAKLHQSLTTDIGNPHLEKQLVSVITLMNISKDWREFMKFFNKKFGQQELDFNDENTNQNKPNDLSDFNKKLTKALNYKPKDKGKNNDKNEAAN